MTKLPKLTPSETIEIPSDCYWRAGLNNNLYWWKNPHNQPEKETFELNVYSVGKQSKTEYPINNRSGLLFVDRKSHLYFGESVTIGDKVYVYDKAEDLLWSWDPDERIHTFAITVDTKGRLWYTTTEFDNSVYSYDPTNGLVSYPLIKIDTVEGLAVTDNKTIYSIQLPTVGHIVMCSDINGNVLHQVGEKDIKRAYSEKAEDWEIYYPENIFYDEKDRLWIDEMGRDCITIVDSALNIIGRFDYKDFDLKSPKDTKGQMNGRFHFGFGDDLLWVKEARETPEIILHSYIIE